MSLLAGDVWKRCLAQGDFTSSHFHMIQTFLWWFIMMLIQMFNDVYSNTLYQLLHSFPRLEDTERVTVFITRPSSGPWSDAAKHGRSWKHWQCCELHGFIYVCLVYRCISWYIDVYRISPKRIKLTILIGGMMINPYLAFVTLHIPALLLSVIDLKGL